MSKWIFQDIKDIGEEYLPNIVLAPTNEEFVRLREEYYSAIRDKVSAETFVRYELWKCDIYVDVDFIEVETKAIYKDSVTSADVLSWILEHKEKHHVLQYS